MLGPVRATRRKQDHRSEWSCSFLCEILISYFQGRVFRIIQTIPRKACIEYLWRRLVGTFNATLHAGSASSELVLAPSPQCPHVPSTVTWAFGNQWPVFLRGSLKCSPGLDAHPAVFPALSCFSAKEGLQAPAGTPAPSELLMVCGHGVQVCPCPARQGQSQGGVGQVKTRVADHETHWDVTNE